MFIIFFSSAERKSREIQGITFHATESAWKNCTSSYSNNQHYRYHYRFIYHFIQLIDKFLLCSSIDFLSSLVFVNKMGSTYHLKKIGEFVTNYLNMNIIIQDIFTCADAKNLLCNDDDGLVSMVKHRLQQVELFVKTSRPKRLSLPFIYYTYVII